MSICDKPTAASGGGQLIFMKGNTLKLLLLHYHPRLQVGERPIFIPFAAISLTLVALKVAVTGVCNPTTS